MTTEMRVPEDLMRTVRTDLRRVRPLAPPGRRALYLLPLGLLLLAGMPALWGERSNLPALGPFASWGLSVLQAFVGLWIVAAALREAVPGRQLGGLRLAAIAAAAGALFTVLTFLTQRFVPTSVASADAPRLAWECFWMAAVWSVPALVVVAWLASRALPTRPVLAGALCGLGAGIMADAGVRLFCWISTPAHVLLSHGGAILFLTALGALAGAVYSRVSKS